MVTKFKFSSQNILSELPEQERSLFEEKMHPKNYRKNHAIFTEKTLPTGIYYLQQGKVKKYKVDREGKEQIIYIYTAGEFFGYSALLGEEQYIDTVIAIEDAVVCYIPKKDFENILDTSPTFSRLLLKSLSREFSALVNLMTVLSQRNVKERIALCLLILHDKYRIAGENEVLIGLSRSDLANMAGTVLETLVRVLHDFKADHLVEMQGRKIKLNNIPGLYRIANLS